MPIGSDDRNPSDVTENATGTNPPATSPRQRFGNPPRPNTALMITARLFAALLISLLLGEGIWSRVGHHLSVSTNIVGSTTFTAFDINRYLDAFYLIAIVLPALAVGMYAVLARWGPLRKAPRVDPQWPLHYTNDPLNEPHEVSGPLVALSEVARLLVPSCAVALEVSLITTYGRRTYTYAGFIGGIVYVLICLGLSALLTWGRAPRQRHPWFARGMKMALPRANIVGILLLVPGLYLVSTRTNLYVASTHSDIHYPWFPLPAAVAVLILFGGSLAWLWRRRPSTVQARQIESAVLRYFVGAVVLFLISARLWPALGSFGGFDDSHYLVGAQLIFKHGFNPFRNLYLLHGVFADAFYGQLGISMFGNSRWAAVTGQTLLIEPLTTVFMYWFAVYFGRRNKLIAGAALFALALGLIPPLTTRFALLPPLLVVFDRVIRRQSWIWSGGFMLLLVFECIVTPETGLMAIGLLGTIVAFDLAHRSGKVRHPPAGLRSWPCLVWGLGFTVVWAVYLLATGALGTFLDYYITAVPGHQYEGSFPLQWNLGRNLADDVYFMLPVFLFLITVLYVTVIVRRRQTWRSGDWVLTACSSFVPLYYTKALDRLDMGHVIEVFSVTVPLLILWSIRILGWADSYVRRCVWLGIRPHAIGPNTKIRAATVGFPVTLASCVALAFLSTNPIKDVVNSTGGFYAESPEPAPATQPKLGYTVPGTVDVAQIDALGKALDAYAGPTAPVYDFSGEVGVLYYLLDRLPASRFYFTQIVQTTYAQQIVIHDLEHTRPPVIVFNNSSFGLPDYDGITTMERDYNLSQYVLDHYRPVVDVGGQLLMLRDDLHAGATQLPPLGVPVRSTDLYDDMPSCNWGDVPNFFPVPSNVKQPTATLPLRLSHPGTFEQIAVSGWAFSRLSESAPKGIVVVSNGAVIGETKRFLVREDVAHVVGAAAGYSGFSVGFVASSATVPYTLYALNPDGTVSPFYTHGADVERETTLTLSDGSTHPVTAAVREGLLSAIDSTKASSFEGAAVIIPRDVNLSAYNWVTFGAGAQRFGKETIEITDAPASADHSIRFSTLPSHAGAYSLQTGSCLQWHGYQGDPLYVVVTGSGSPVLPSSISLIDSSK